MIKKAPCNDQTAEQVQTYYRSVKPGDAVNLDNLTGRHNTTVITDYDPKVDQLQLLNNAFVAKSSDHHGGTLLHVGSETIDLVGVRPNEVDRHEWA